MIEARKVARKIIPAMAGAIPGIAAKIRPKKARTAKIPPPVSVTPKQPATR